MEREPREGIGALLEMLGEAASMVGRLEAEAHEALFSRDDAGTHRKKLQEKAMILMELPERGEPFLGGLDAPAAREIRRRLEDFARRAGQALDLGSIFYLSALLHPDDEKEGDENDLERFVREAQKRFA
jgi:hypothetical protein